MIKNKRKKIEQSIGIYLKKKISKCFSKNICFCNGFIKIILEKKSEPKPKKISLNKYPEVILKKSKNNKGI